MNADLGRVEHLEAEDVEGMRWTGADDLREAADADAHQFAARALLGLLRAKLPVADLLHRELERSVIVAAVVLPPRGRLVRELLGSDEVLEPEVGGVDA